MRKLGVFVCHCGINIAGTVDVEAVAAAMRGESGVRYAATYKYLCSDPGQQIIRDAVREHDLSGVVIAACSPAMHETTFRRAVAAAGMNPYLLECANIREQCSWVHQQDQERATAKATDIVRSLVAKVRRNAALDPLALPLTKRAMVVGGGVAGIAAALDIAEAGYPVVMVERSPRLGGKMAELSGSFLNFSGGRDILGRWIERVATHPQISVLTEAEVVGLDGYVGNFQVNVGRAGRDFETHEVGAVIAATGFDRYSLSGLVEYGGGNVPDVVDALTFEGMLGPGRELRRPSDGKVPGEVVFVQCAGSRDPEHGVAYCSKVCCMVSAKQALLYRERVPGGQSYVFYIDIRSAGKGYDEYVQRAMTEGRAVYLRGKVSRIFRDGDKVVVWGSDTLSGRAIEIYADLVVLATPMAAGAGARELAQRLRVSTNADGFFNEAHPKLRPVESLTAGVFLAGTVQGPRDIPETVAQAGAAAAKVIQLFSREELMAEPAVAQVEAELCSACGLCVKACPYGAREVDTLARVAAVNPALCQSCGACAAACPNKASTVRNWTPEQILAMADILL